MPAERGRLVRAAGGALWRPATGGGIETALVHRPRYDDWSLPKGKPDEGEHLLETAVREVAEETGLASSSDGAACAPSTSCPRAPSGSTTG